MTNNDTKVTWLLLRGLLREQGHWGDFPSQLQQHLPDIKIITLDIPGNGLKHLEKSPSSIAEMVDELRCQYKVEQPLNILALSMGGMMATNWMQRFPHEISKAVLINTSLKKINPFYHRLRPSNYLRLLGLMSNSHDKKEKSILKLTTNNPLRRQKALGNWLDIARTRGVSKRNAIRQIIAASTFSPQEKPPIQDILFLNSQHDRIVNPKCSEHIAITWRKSLITHPTAGHDIPLDDPEWVITALCKFSDKLVARI